MLLLLLCVLSLSTFAQGYTTVDFHQAENDRNGTKTYDINWVNGILNATHTDYFEGIGVPQRIIFTGIKPNKAPNQTTHSLVFQVLADKATSHAYDFPISWEQAVATAAQIGNGSVNELGKLFDQKCGDALSAVAKPVCDALGALNPGVLADAAKIKTPAFPNSIGNPGKPTLGAPNVDDNITCFEEKYGDRTLEIRGSAAITSATISFDGYKGSGRDYAQYTLTWVSSSSEIMIRFATHLAVGAGPCGYGANKGAASISGGPYHVVLNTIDGVSLGSQDNQIMSNAIQIPPSCAIIAPPAACAGAGNVTFSVTQATGETYAWSITNVSGANPSPLSGTGASFVVNVGNTAGTFDVNLSVTSAGGVTSCTQTYTVYPPVVTNAGDDQTVCSSSPAVTLAGSVSGGATTGTWSTSGDGTFDDATKLNAVYTPGTNDIKNGSVTLTLTSAEPTGPCDATSDNMLVTISPRPGKPTAAVVLPLCTDETMTVEVTLPAGLSSSATVTLKQMTGGHAPITVNASTAVGGKLTFTGLTFGKGYSISILDNVSTANPGGCTSLPEECGTFTDGGQAVTRLGRLAEQEIVLNSDPKTKVLAAPNPFNDRIRFTLKSNVTGQGSLELFNMLGQKVKTVFQGYVNAGQSQVIEYAVPVSQRSNLIYLFRVGGEKTSGKLIGLKQ